MHRAMRLQNPFVGKTENQTVPEDGGKRQNPNLLVNHGGPLGRHFLASSLEIYNLMTFDGRLGVNHIFRHTHVDDVDDADIGNVDIFAVKFEKH